MTVCKPLTIRLNTEQSTKLSFFVEDTQLLQMSIAWPFLNIFLNQSCTFVNSFLGNLYILGALTVWYQEGVHNFNSQTFKETCTLLGALGGLKIFTTTLNTWKKISHFLINFSNFWHHFASRQISRVGKSTLTKDLLREDIYHFLVKLLVQIILIILKIHIFWDLHIGV